MYKLFLEKEELSLINHAIYTNIKKIETKVKEDEQLKDKYNPIIDKLAETWSYMSENKDSDNGILICHSTLLDIVESLFVRIEELNRLIIRNRTEGYPTDVYEGSKKELVDLYEKLMLSRLNNI